MTIATWIDNHLLQNQSTQLAQLQSALRRQIAGKRESLAQLQNDIDLAEAQLRTCLNCRATALAEIDALESRIVALRATAATEATAAAAATAAQAELADIKAEQAQRATALKEIERRHRDLSAELAGLQVEISAAKQQLEQHQGALEQARASVDAEIAAIAAMVATERERATKELSAELAAAKASAEAELARTEAEIELARRRFQVETDAVLNTIEKDKIDATKEITSEQNALLEKWGPILTDPLEAEIKALEAENGRLAKLLTAKQGTSLEWQPEQIAALLTHNRQGELGPNHLRIAGASESGKSHLVNQLIAGGLASLGVAAKFTVLDPFGSDTTWAIPPTVSDDPELAAATVREWAEAAKDRANRLSSPNILVVDEADTLIKDYQLAGTVKDLIKMGRHANRFIWFCGQNGNAVPGLQWSDLRNVSAIYLSAVAVDYVENGMKGRDRNRLLGELEALSEKTRYYALVQPKEKKPYSATVPERLFPKATTAEPKATATAAPAQSPGAALVCPKCESTRVKRNGSGRIYCHDCGKNSTVGK